MNILLSSFPGPQDIAGIAAGDTHSLAWATTGVLFPLGTRGTAGSDNSHTPRPSPLVIPGVTNGQAVARGTESYRVCRRGHSLTGQSDQNARTSIDCHSASQFEFRIR
jgi:hypothetical protein